MAVLCLHLQGVCRSRRRGFGTAFVSGTNYSSAKLTEKNVSVACSTRRVMREGVLPFGCCCCYARVSVSPTKGKNDKRGLSMSWRDCLSDGGRESWNKEVEETVFIGRGKPDGMGGQKQPNVKQITIIVETREMYQENERSWALVVLCVIGPPSEVKHTSHAPAIPLFSRPAQQIGNIRFRRVKAFWALIHY